MFTGDAGGRVGKGGWIVYFIWIRTTRAPVAVAIFRMAIASNRKKKGEERGSGKRRGERKIQAAAT